jgi:hypothetical protein
MSEHHPRGGRHAAHRRSRLPAPLRPGIGNGITRVIVLIIVVVFAGALLLRGYDLSLALAALAGTGYVAVELAGQLLGRPTSRRAAQ